ncbi:hypothetical protein ZIOFF_000497 [Zingiber officinale]|uniref:PDZ domain-containing protein n=1 Tax=Zingiber officinale TaxID=94328 RepID=A0A8J5HXH9_ZINOF|nr:hypothetical protein ZIOFF_000497 [Zingiber officinale]
MFRALLSRNPRRGVATGLLALTAFCAGGATLGSSSDRPSHRTTDVAISISVPLRQLLSSTPSIFSQVFALSFSVPSPESSPRHYSTANPLPPPDPSKDVPCCAGCLGRNTIAKAAAAAGPAVVNICVTEGEPQSVELFEWVETIAYCQMPTCVLEVSLVGVTLQDGREFEGTVINADFPSDIAVVKIHSKTPLPSVKFGSSSKLLPGDWVIALGCPLTLQNTITSGIVSCVDRKSSDLGLGGIRREYLQTDCAINEAGSLSLSWKSNGGMKGNSGGPLVNLDGEVVGVNIMKVAAADGLSFAVPIDSVIKIIEQFRKNGTPVAVALLTRVVRPWLGLKMLDLNEMKIAQFKERDDSFPDVIKGVLVPVVTPGSPGDRAGFRPGDVVIEFDGRPVGGIKEIIGIMEDKVGVPLKVLVKRSNNKSITLTVVPEEAVD